MNRPRPAAHRFDAFAVAPPGIEPIVAQELGSLGIKNLTAVDGGVEFGASPRQLHDANLRLRTASRILVRLSSFRALTFAELEKRLQRVEWGRVLSRGQRVALRVTCRKSRLYHSDAVAQRVERDLAARFGALATRVSSGDESADGAIGAQLIIVRFDHDHCTISADSSGAHLHQRGYRTSVTTAPIRETLAAALIIASGWDRESPLLDPFCGSGTIPIEAAMMAARITPGKNRPFQFMHWPGFDASEWRSVLSRAIADETTEGVPSIVGSDRSTVAVRAAMDNAQRAGVAKIASIVRADVAAMVSPEPHGWIVTNPPYGVRLGDSGDARRLMAQFGRVLRERFAGWHVTALLPEKGERAIGMPLQTAFRTTNGGLRVAAWTGTTPARRARRSTSSRAEP